MKYIKIFENFQPKKKYFIGEFAVDYPEEHKFYYLWELIKDQGDLMICKCHKILNIYHMSYMDFPPAWQITLSKKIIYQFEIALETNDIKEAEEYLDNELQMRLQSNKYNL